MDALNVVLGAELRLQRGDVVITGDVIRGRRVRLVLAYVVLERPHPILVSDLVRAVWSEEPPASWPSSIREIVSRVRTLLTMVGCPGAVSTRDRSLHIALPDDICVDVEQALADARRFREAAAAGACHLGTGEDLTACAAKVLDATSSPFLSGEESPWVHGWRVRLQQAMGVALTTLAEAALARGDAVSAAELAGRMIAGEPTTEVGHALLMRSQQLAGQRAEALWTYDRYRRLLADQLGVDPPASLQALHLDLLRDEDHRPASLAPSVAAVAPPPWPLCTSVARELPFVGRKGVMDGITKTLAAGRHGGIVLVRGEPASGKTRLLAELIECASLPAGPVLYGRCEPGAADPGGAIWQALGDYDVVPASGPAQVQEAITRLIGLGRGQTVTLLLDDVQWADELTVRFVGKMVSQRFGGSVAVVAAYSSTGQGRCLHKFLADLHRAARPRLVDLEPLGPSAVQALVCRMVGRGPAAGVPTTAHLLEESGGNAGYLAELLLAHTEGNGTGVPAAISARVVPMLDELDPTPLDLLRAAAVAGPLFRLAQAAQAAGLARADVWLRTADELIMRGLLATVEAAPGHLRFRHGVVRRVVLESMGPLTREQLRTRQQALAAVTPPAISQHRPNERPARQTYRQWHCGEILRSR